MILSHWAKNAFYLILQIIFPFSCRYIIVHISPNLLLLIPILKLQIPKLILQYDKYIVKLRLFMYLPNKEVFMLYELKIILKLVYL